MVGRFFGCDNLSEFLIVLIVVLNTMSYVSSEYSTIHYFRSLVCGDNDRCEMCREKRTVIDTPDNSVLGERRIVGENASAANTHQSLK